MRHQDRGSAEGGSRCGRSIAPQPLLEYLLILVFYPHQRIFLSSRSG